MDRSFLVNHYDSILAANRKKYWQAEPGTHSWTML